MALERLLRMASNLVRTAEVLDRAGLHEEADQLTGVLERVAQYSGYRGISDLLSEAPGGFRHQQENLPHMAIGREMGLNFNPLVAGFWGQGPETPMNMDSWRNPFALEGKSQEEIKKLMQDWYNSPAVRDWYGKQQGRISEYTKWLKAMAQDSSNPAAAAQAAALLQQLTSRQQPMPA